LEHDIASFFADGKSGYVRVVRIGRNTEVRPLGGGLGCLAMILISVLLSVGLTLLLNAGR
jgi:hypothetical protein